MKKYDIWFYSVFVEAENETAAIERINGVLDRALLVCETLEDQQILEGMQIDYAEEII